MYALPFGPLVRSYLQNLGCVYLLRGLCRLGHLRQVCRRDTFCGHKNLRLVGRVEKIRLLNRRRSCYGARSRPRHAMVGSRHLRARRVNLIVLLLLLLLLLPLLLWWLELLLLLLLLLLMYRLSFLCFALPSNPCSVEDCILWQASRESSLHQIGGDDTFGRADSRPDCLCQSGLCFRGENHLRLSLLLVLRLHMVLLMVRRL